MCFYCKGKSIIPSKTTHVVTFDNCVVVIRNVPCEECEQCGEKFFSDSVMESLENTYLEAKKMASEIFVTDYTNRVA